MKRRALLLGAAACACTGREWNFGFARRLLATSNGADAETERWALAELATMAERAAALLEAGLAPASALSQVLFQEHGFAREVERSDAAFVRLSSVLRQRRGNCVGLGTTYLALASALGVRASGILLPAHFYVRQREHSRPRNVELLRRGEAMPDEWYRQRYPLPGSARASAYARDLSESEVLGVVEFDLGNGRRLRRDLAGARLAYERATELLPEFAEAHASLGLTQQLLGNPQAARVSYEAAARLDPELPGLARNRQLL